jgi:UDP-N-acetyl-D-mannosaminuronic acid transferase (WecB/TagA/CpsF family)
MSSGVSHRNISMASTKTCFQGRGARHSRSRSATEDNRRRAADGRDRPVVPRALDDRSRPGTSREQTPPLIVTSANARVVAMCARDQDIRALFLGADASYADSMPLTTSRSQTRPRSPLPSMPRVPTFCGLGMGVPTARSFALRNRDQPRGVGVIAAAGGLFGLLSG